jgi:hypothetical protein
VKYAGKFKNNSLLQDSNVSLNISLTQDSVFFEKALAEKRAKLAA